MKEMLLLNTGFQEKKPFYEVYARDHVISELTEPVNCFCRSDFWGIWRAQIVLESR